MRPVKRHRWYKPGASHRGGSRKCIDCGLQRRVKRGTRMTWEFRIKPGETWLSQGPYCIAPATPKRSEVRR